MSERDTAICEICEKEIEYYPGHWASGQSAYWFHVEAYPHSEKHEPTPKKSAPPKPVEAAKERNEYEGLREFLDRKKAAPTPSPIDTTGQEKRWRKRPVIIDALQYDGTNHDAIKRFTQGRCYRDVNDPNHPLFMIRTLEGEHVASVGDYIIKGVKGEFYPCKPDIFAQTYELVAPASIATTQGDEVSLREELFKLLDGWHGLAHRPRHMNQIMLVIQKRYPDAK